MSSINTNTPTHDLEAVKDHLKHANEAHKNEKHAEKQEKKAVKAVEKAEQKEEKAEEKLAKAEHKLAEAHAASAREPGVEKLQTKEYKEEKNVTHAKAEVEKAQIALREAEERLNLKSNQHGNQVGHLDQAVETVGGDSIGAAGATSQTYGSNTAGGEVPTIRQY